MFRQVRSNLAGTEPFQAITAQAERMLNTTFDYYHNQARRIIQPTTRFGNLSSHGSPLDQPVIASSEDLVANCDTVIRPDCLRDLYGFPNPSTDIIDGRSGGCYGPAQAGSSTANVLYAGWNATKGWDPVTGWGTPSFQALSRLATSADSLMARGANLNWKTSLGSL